MAMYSVSEFWRYCFATSSVLGSYRLAFEARLPPALSPSLILFCSLFYFTMAYIIFNDKCWNGEYARAFQIRVQHFVSNMRLM